MASFSNAIDQVKKKYKFDFDLKEEQKTIIRTLALEKTDVMGMLPTGFGKSLIYIMVPLILDELEPSTIKHMVIVVSPLIALMKDQLKFLLDHSVAGAMITEETSVKDLKDMSTTGISVLLTSPESAVSPKRRSYWKEANSTCLLVFDEAHCISSWGQDFRPTYRNVCVLQSFFEVPNLVLTATATKQIQYDIYSVLSFDPSKTKVVSALPDRPNIFLDIKECTENFETELSWLLELLRTGPQNKKIITFVKSVNQCYKIYLWMMTSLMETGFAEDQLVENRRIEMFHANTDIETKERIIAEFVNPQGKIELLICTVAFGMGVNIPNVDVVVHWGLPSTTLQYWQEVGRCARDGRHGYTICYAYKRSITKCEDKELKKLTESECMRHEVLKIFLLDGMDKASLDCIKPSLNCVDKCHVCACRKCKCCIRCYLSCPCKGKLPFPLNHFLSRKS